MPPAIKHERRHRSKKPEISSAGTAKHERFASKKGSIDSDSRVRQSQGLTADLQPRNHETPSAAEGRNQTDQKENDRGFRGYARMCKLTLVVFIRAYPRNPRFFIPFTALKIFVARKGFTGL
ncbi:MAG TPA: hypothetical protein VKU82_10805 [Planctomycetaceae bacterium]|nr:hypothetical protein [Planctomycetaceae bacterium]